MDLQATQGGGSKCVALGGQQHSFDTGLWLWPIRFFYKALTFLIRNMEALDVQMRIERGTAEGALMEYC